MTGPKLNEKSFVAGERSGTKATARYVRSSASKARAVLDLIRGLDVRSADQVLQFTDRHIARDVRKVLASAVANAINNDGQDADELYVVACFADEGPTLKRFRPRARGRATRINKRSCHITVIVARMSDERIAIITARQERAGGGSGRGRPQSSAASRRARVERSRAKTAAESSDDSASDLTAAGDKPATSDDTDVSAAAEGSAGDEAEAARGKSAADDEPAINEGSAGDEAEAARGESAADDEPAIKEASAGDEAESDEDTDESAAAEGSASDEAESDEDADVSSADEGSASDEAEASRGGNEVDDEGAK
jgi:large subunit ribosomal protein L22